MPWLRYVSLKISVNLYLICFQKAALNFGDLLQEPLQRYAYTTICDEDTVFFNPKFKAKTNFINLGKKEAKPVKLDGVAPYHSCALYIDRINAELFFSWWSCPQRQGRHAIETIVHVGKLRNPVWWNKRSITMKIFGMNSYCYTLTLTVVNNCSN